MRLARVKDIVLHRVGIPLYAPLHRRNLRQGRSEAFAQIEAIAKAPQRRLGPLILLGLHQHLGDVVMASAVIRQCRRLHPDATLVFATQPRHRALIACDCVGSLLELAEHPAFDQRHLLLLHGTECEICGAVHQDSHAPHREQGIDARRWFRHRRHLVDLMFERLGYENDDKDPEIFIPADISAAAQRRLRDLVPAERSIVAMHLKTPHWPAKQWPHENFHALMARVTAELGVQVVVVGAEPVGDLPVGVIDLARQTSLLETAALLAEATLFVGLDSGPSHLAAAVRTPSVLLFGPTDPATCRPLGKAVSTLWCGCNEDGLFAHAIRPGERANRDIAKITIEEVFIAIRNAVAATDSVAAPIV
jgi:ADP-heptose:LPS heptosyltransferase